MTNQMTDVTAGEAEMIDGGWVGILVELAILAFELWEGAGHAHEADQGLRDGYAAGQGAWQ